MPVLIPASLIPRQVPAIRASGGGVLPTSVTSDVTFEFTEDDWERGGIPQMFNSNFQMITQSLSQERPPSPPPTGTDSGGVFTVHLRNRP